MNSDWDFAALHPSRLCLRYMLKNRWTMSTTPDEAAYDEYRENIGDVGEKLKCLWDQEKFCQSFTNVPKILAKAIAAAVGRGRPFSYSIGGFLGGSSHGRYGSYGYPKGGLHSDFFLPWLRNLRPQQYLNEQDWEKFKSWQEQLMKKEVLLSYFEIVEETRKPLRDKFYKEMRDREKRRSTDQPK